MSFNKACCVWQRPSVKSQIMFNTWHGHHSADHSEPACTSGARNVCHLALSQHQWFFISCLVHLTPVCLPQSVHLHEQFNQTEVGARAAFLYSTVTVRVYGREKM